MQTGPIFHERNSYRRPLIIAHRGCNNYAPQNSLPAFETVAKMGVWAIETDIHLTRDGVAVCIHDSTLNTMTDSEGIIEEMTFDEVRKARINRGVGADKLPSDALRVPTFEEYLDICMRYGCVPFIEFKTPEGVEAAIKSLRRRGMLDYAVASSVKFDYIAEARRCENCSTCKFTFKGDSVKLFFTHFIHHSLCAFVNDFFIDASFFKLAGNIAVIEFLNIFHDVFSFIWLLNVVMRKRNYTS